MFSMVYIDDLMQDCVLAMELPQSCMKPLTYFLLLN